ncbi:hypothetical protein [Niveispirillum cyanobacteriorum]|uniref:Uncharacterized protein n=1 Tax=Niveispirillum cyanobacteriorum TaxID=1612173 RepID=A0A2K9NG49_9PROT|nr:hypothetical protein [Niveispirillum cyanobacteriorum]AUN31992.1 hypothetical protein C0V82_16310 [Niveispirillum cyanobacteriorum]GGE85120.1 hypothetical protein GCM10011317_47920 [Niveispirillum cyanobacteriorum]
MNLRILKKLSARAAPLLPLLGDRREQFRARKEDAYIGILIMDRKHWDRGRSVHGDYVFENTIKRRAADGRGWIYMHPPSFARKGTVMVGCMSGGEEPEWSEESAWEALDSLVRDFFTDYQRLVDDDCCTYGAALTRDLSTPSKILLAAREIIRAGGAA